MTTTITTGKTITYKGVKVYYRKGFAQVWFGQNPIYKTLKQAKQFVDIIADCV